MTTSTWRNGWALPISVREIRKIEEQADDENRTNVYFRKSSTIYQIISSTSSSPYMLSSWSLPIPFGLIIKYPLHRPCILGDRSYAPNPLINSGPPSPNGNGSILPWHPCGDSCNRHLKDLLNGSLCSRIDSLREVSDHLEDSQIILQAPCPVFFKCHFSIIIIVR